MTLLPDGSYFSQTNHFVASHCNTTKLNSKFNFRLKNGVFLASPTENGSAIGDCGSVNTERIHTHDGAAAQVGCSGYLSSGSLSPKIMDLYAWTLNKTELTRLECHFIIGPYRDAMGSVIVLVECY